MKKLFIILSAMFCLIGCSTSNEDVIYSLSLASVKDHISTGYLDGDITSFEATENAYATIKAKIAAYRSEYITGAEWIENVNNGKFSKSDKSAKTRFNEAESALESLQSECDAIVKGIPSSAKGYFVISSVLSLSRFNEGKTTVLEEKEFSVSFDSDNGANIR